MFVAHFLNEQKLWEKANSYPSGRSATRRHCCWHTYWLNCVDGKKFGVWPLAFYFFFISINSIIMFVYIFSHKNNDRFLCYRNAKNSLLFSFNIFLILIYNRKTASRFRFNRFKSNLFNQIKLKSISFCFAFFFFTAQKKSKRVRPELNGVDYWECNAYAYHLEFCSLPTPYEMINACTHTHTHMCTKSQHKKCNCTSSRVMMWPENLYKITSRASLSLSLTDFLLLLHFVTITYPICALCSRARINK